MILPKDPNAPDKGIDDPIPQNKQPGTMPNVAPIIDQVPTNTAFTDTLSTPTPLVNTEGTNILGGAPLTTTSHNIPGTPGYVGPGGTNIGDPIGDNINLFSPTPIGGTGNVATTATDPNTALTTQTISRAPGVDRFALAQDAVKNWETATNPQFQADLRDANRVAAGAGRLNSGELRTSLGDITANRDIQRNAAEKSYLDDALAGTIADQFGDVGIAQQQQGFQAGQQQTAFEQALRQALGEDTLTGNAFQRALQEAEFGYQGNPSTTQLAISQIFGGQGAAGGAAAGALGQATGNQGTNPYVDALMQYLKGLPGYGGAAPAGTPVTSGLPNG